MVRQNYEAQIAQLNETIRQNNEFINRLMDQLKDQGQKTEKAERKVEKLEHRIEELLDEIRQLNKRVKDLIDRDKRHNKMSMGKKSFRKHNRVEPKESRQEEKDDYDNRDAKKQEESGAKESSDSCSSESTVDKTKVTSEFLDQKRSERGKYNAMQAAKVTKLETSMEGAPTNMKFIGMKTIEEYSKVSYIMTPLHRETVRMAIDKFSSSNQTLRNWLDICANMLKNLMPFVKAKLLGKKAILNIDETWCSIRIKFKGDGTKLGHYLKKYVWVLVNRAAKVVYFLYDNDENDSRGRRPIEKFLDKAMKALQSDGYTVYKQLTKDMTECEHVLCWAHARAKLYK